MRWTALPNARFGAGEVRVLDISPIAAGWIAVGSVTGTTRVPGLWRSSELSTWSPIPIAPVTFYGAQNELYSLAVGTAGVVALGAAAGGAHASPRVGTWYLDGDTLREVSATFELFGGERQGSVGPVAASSAGFALIGNRTDANNRFGATAWWSGDGRAAFTIVDADPALESGPAETVAAHSLAGGPLGFLAVGDRADSRAASPGRSTAATVPLAVDGQVWSSPDGQHWVRAGTAPFGGPGDQRLDRVSAWRQGWIVAGTETTRSGTGFVTWSSPDGHRWTKTRLAGLGHGDVTSSVTALHVVGDRVVLGARLDDRPVLAESPDGRRWNAIAVPPGVKPDAHLAMALTGDPDHLLVSATGTAGSQLWVGVRGS